MKGKLVFLAGTTLGYVLGARAGRKRYEQIRSGAEKFWNSQAVQKRVDQVQSFVDDRAPEIQSKFSGGAKKVVDQVSKRAGGRGPQKGDGATSDSSGSVSGTPSTSVSSAPSTTVSSGTSESPASGPSPDGV
ncbi:YtxH domain-containing protein [Naasia sp. SYSU D00057]|uniref:YtxH domain-containing protein n=1 Tax=Naasia sp. SYSU D00057 TaxID=2817380 RepID=UPI001B3153AE|nr:YtxH domain-containing protein [Naasia sp. SYSU D00057]